MKDGALIAKDNVWMMAAIVVGWAAMSIILEQKYKWASKITGAIIALVGALILSNLKIIPVGSQFEDVVWTYIVPLAIPMLLFKANLIKIGKESGRMLVMFLISSIGTGIGAVVAIMTLSSLVPEAKAVTAMFTGSYIGGTVNFAAMAESFNVSGSTSSAAVVADNLMMALYIMVLIAIPSIGFFRKNFRTPLIDEVENSVAADGDETLVAKFWGRTEISLKDIASTVAIAFALVAVSKLISDQVTIIFAGKGVLNSIISASFGNMYLILTTLTLICATIFSKFFEDLKGTQEIGTFLIYIFFVAIGIPASIPQIINSAPILLVYAGVIVLINMIISFAGAKIFNFSLEEAILASNANIGGPTTAAALAISKGWTKMVAPVMLVGTLGYVIGNYFAIFIANTFF